MPASLFLLRASSNAYKHDVITISVLGILI